MLIRWRETPGGLEGLVENNLVIRLTRITGPAIPAGRMHYIGAASMDDKDVLPLRIWCRTREEAKAAATAQVNDWATRMAETFERITAATRQDVDAASDMLLEALIVEKLIDRGMIGCIKPPNRTIEIHAAGTDTTIQAPTAGRAYLNLKEWADTVRAERRRHANARKRA